MKKAPHTICVPVPLPDPRGLISKTDYDLLGRTTDSIQNFQPAYCTTYLGINAITDYTYDGDGDMLSQTAFNVTANNGPLYPQTTAYIYGVAGGTNNIFSNDLLAKTEYPDPSTGLPSTSASNDVSDTYDALGEQTTMTDENGNVHTYKYDLLGRESADIVTTLGSGVDGAVRRLGYSFNTQGLPYQQTSYSDTAGTSIVNQVQDVYNGLGQLTGQYEAVTGAVNTSSTPEVQYSYNEMSGGADNSRETSMTYPNGRVLDYNYNSGIDTTISRVSNEADAGGTLAGTDEAYTYLGLDTVVQRTQGNGDDLSYIQQTGDTSYINDGGDRYTGLDRFGRVIDQYWSPGSSPTTPTDRFQYAYDQDGNVLSKNNLVNSADSELYHTNGVSNNTAYDGLNRLTSFSRGTLSASGHNGSSGLGSLDTVSSPSTTQSWTLDQLGNWTSSSTNGTGTSRTHNNRNQTTAVGSNSLALDNNGNTKTDDNGEHYYYDAWNRPRYGYTTGSCNIFYTYDALGRRIYDYSGSTGHYLYYSSSGQVIEERSGSTVTDQYVWSADGYVDDLVLRDDSSTSGSLGATSSGLGERLYVQQDANHDVTALTNTSGAVQERFIYNPYGVSTVLSPSWGSTTDAYSWVYGFQGGRYEPATGLYHFGARDYSTTLGRWMEQDPAGYVDGTNVYQAFQNSPIVESDPTGLAATQPTSEGFQVTAVKYLQEPKLYHAYGLDYKVELNTISEAKYRIQTATNLMSVYSDSGMEIGLFYFRVLEFTELGDLGDETDTIQFNGRAHNFLSRVGHINSTAHKVCSVRIDSYYDAKYYVGLNVLYHTEKPTPQDYWEEWGVPGGPKGTHYQQIDSGTEMIWNASDQLVWNNRADGHNEETPGFGTMLGFAGIGPMIGETSHHDVLTYDWPGMDTPTNVHGSIEWNLGAGGASLEAAANRHW